MANSMLQTVLKEFRIHHPVVWLRHACPAAGSQAVLVLVFALMSSGCSTTGKWDLNNPFGSPPPEYKSQYGLTPAQKVDRLRILADNATEMDLERQSTVCKELIATFRKENDPILRRELVRTIGSLSVPDVQEGLQLATEDGHTQVRIAACDALGRRNDSQSVGFLSAMLSEDQDVDVRLAASQALAGRSTPQSLVQLAATLEDRDPAIQLATMESLRAATGADIGDNVKDWMNFLESRTVNPSVSSPSAESIASDAPAATYQLLGGEGDSQIAQPPVYDDVTSGSSIYR